MKLLRRQTSKWFVGVAQKAHNRAKLLRPSVEETATRLNLMHGTEPPPIGRAISGDNEIHRQPKIGSGPRSRYNDAEKSAGCYVGGDRHKDPECSSGVPNGRAAWSRTTAIADYIAIGVLIACMLGAGAMVLSRAKAAGR